MAGFDLLIDFRFGVTLEETLPASLSLPEHRASLLIASGRTLVGAEEAARGSLRHAQQHDGCSCVAPGARVSGLEQHSPVRTCLEVCGKAACS